MKYAETVESLLENMEDVQGPTLNKIFEKIGTAASVLRHLPYCGLKAKKHRFGCLRAWIKYKSFAEWDGKKWTDLKFRPLVSYKSHRWKKLFTMVSRF